MTQSSKSGHSPKEDPILKKFMGELTSVRPFIQDAFLFGSRARGHELPTSDYDILIVVTDQEHKKMVKEKAHDAANQLELQHPVDISLKIFPKSHYQSLRKLGVPFIKNIIKEGISLNDL